MQRKKVGEILLDSGVITKEQLEQAIAFKGKKSKRVGEALIELNIVTEDEIFQTLSKQLNIELINENRVIDKKAIDLLPADFCYKRRILPVSIEGNNMTLAMADPTDFETMKEVSFITNYNIKTVIIKEQELINRLILFYPPTNDFPIESIEAGYLADLIEVINDSEVTDVSDSFAIKDLVKMTRGEGIIHLTNSIIATGIKRRASDIHIEPQEDDVSVRYRIDGIMHEIMKFSKKSHVGVISRVKIISGLDITKRRKPQDGHTQIKIGNKTYDLRISSLPTHYGEKIVIRILETKAPIPLEELGLPERDLSVFKRLISSPQGLILVTGPTGSGKTNTLYAALHHKYSPKINIVTIEDPIEFSIPGINQVQVNPLADLTFSTGLRSLLRQDPNVIMIGEIRDGETAEIACRAAQTGHLVLSTLHTNDALSTIIRLIDLGIEPYLVSNSLICVIAQRLARRIHDECSIVTSVNPSILDRFNIKTDVKFKKGQGCKNCMNTGYMGRIAMFEFVAINQAIKELILKNADIDEIAFIAKKNGMVSMTEDGYYKAKRNITTLEEVLRVAPPGENFQLSQEYMDDQYQKCKTDSLSSKSINTESINMESINMESINTDTKKKQKRVFIVDDDETIVEYIKSILKGDNYEIDTAMDGKEALEKIIQNPPDLIITDYIMPKMVGIDLIKNVKSKKEFKNIPVIMLTGFDTKISEIQAFQAGVDDWIQKPIYAPRLKLRVKHLLELYNRITK